MVSSSSAQETQNTFPDGVLSHEDIFNAEADDDIACYRIPSVVTAPNGDLIAAIDERKPSCGDLKWSRDINIVVRRSTDHGLSWSEIERVADFPLGKLHPILR